VTPLVVRSKPGDTARLLGDAATEWQAGQKLIGLDGKPVASGRVSESALRRLKRSRKSRNCWSNARARVCVSPAPDLD